MAEHHSDLCRFLRTNRDAILDTWQQQIRQLPVASRLSHPRLLDHLPDLLDHVAQMICPSRDAGGALSPEAVSTAELHALQRLDSGFDVGVVATEYALLRGCILQMYGGTMPSLPVPEMQRFSFAIDEAIVISVERYARARERTLSGLDRISQAALDSNDVEQFLPKLLGVLMETTEAVDSAAIFLCDGGIVRLRAAVGMMEADLARGFEVKTGEGFVGRIAQEREPLELRDAMQDPLVLAPGLKKAGARALYGVPMIQHGMMLGVAQIGSRTAHVFSEEDKLFFRAMTHRATALLVQAELQDKLRESDRRARELLEFEQRLMGIVSHDLRNPLAGILTSASLLLRMGGLDDRQARALARIVSSAQRGGRLIKDLLDFTQARLGGNIPIQPQPADLHAIARRVCEEVQLNFPERELRVEHEGDAAGEWDADRIAQVVANLVTNAIQYSPDDTPVVVRTVGLGDEVRLTIHNRGAAIPPDAVSTLFEPFRRGTTPETGAGAVTSSATGSTSTGIGLGLYIVQRLVDAHRGRIDVQSSDHEGTTFTVTLPTKHRPQPPHDP